MAPNFTTEADAAGNYPAFRFNQRERKMLESIQEAYPKGIIASGTFNTLGGDANESITVSGVLASDIVHVNVKTAGATPRSIVSQTAASNAINVVLSGDPSTDHVLQYIVVRSK